MSLRAFNDNASHIEQKGIFCRYARELVMARGRIAEAAKHAEASRAHENVIAILKTAVAAGTTTDASWAAPLYQYQASASAFLASLRSRSVFDAVRLGGATQLAPLMSQVVVTSGVTAGNQGEQGGILVQKMSLSTGRISLKQVSAIVVVSEEVARFGSAETTGLFDTELQRAVAAATDSQWLAQLYASVTPTGTAGATTANMSTDLRALVSALTFGPGDSIVIAYAPAALAKLGLATDTAGAKSFPGIGIDGGNYAGITFMASDQLPSGAAVAIVCNGFITTSEPPLIDASTAAAVQFDTTPDSPPGSGTNMISLWQQGYYGVRVLRSYGSSMVRSASVSALSGVSY